MKKMSIKLKIFLGLILIISVTFGLLLYFISKMAKPVDPNTKEVTKFVVPKGQAVSVIAGRLQEENLIQNSYIFRYVAKKDGLESKIQAGSFDLSKNMSTSEIALKLTSGTEDVWVTILEGWRAEEIAESLSSQNLDNFDATEFLELAKASEGMLFPDTYLIPREMSAQQIYSLLINTFESKVSKALSEEIESSSREFEQILIMASLVEREAKTYDQMRRVAGILWNRIDLGMALQVDATLQYANGFDKQQKKWWAVPNASDKKIQSPFNTYLNSGLPPKPISNPGLDAIKSALDPLESDDLYYIHANDGKMYYSATLDGHNANINAYLR